TPGDVVGTALPLPLMVVPVPPVIDVGELEAAVVAVVVCPPPPVGRDVGTGPSDDVSEAHAAVSSARTHAIGIVRFLRTSTPFTAG
ncbi:MAG: hypothetical protein ACXVP3_08305, partial [Actinomycetota bacterium]